MYMCMYISCYLLLLVAVLFAIVCDMYCYSSAFTTLKVTSMLSEPSAVIAEQLASVSVLFIVHPG